MKIEKKICVGFNLKSVCFEGPPRQGLPKIEVKVAEKNAHFSLPSGSLTKTIAGVHLRQQSPRSFMATELAHKFFSLDEVGVANIFRQYEVFYALLVSFTSWSSFFFFFFLLFYKFFKTLIPGRSEI